TTASLMIAATLGVTRGGNVLAWDNNETRGTLGWRGIPTEHHRTAVDLLHDIDRLRSPEASNADLDPYVRPQGAMRFDILASDEDPGSAASIDAEAFGELNDALSRFYRIKVIDTGNNVRASNWLAAVRSADQLIIISTVREDTFNAAAWMIDELRATGLAEQVDHAVTILSHSSRGKLDATLRDRLRAHFGAHTRAVTEVPYEQQFVDGSHLHWDGGSTWTKEAWLDATALIIDGLSAAGATDGGAPSTAHRRASGPAPSLSPCPSVASTSSSTRISAPPCGCVSRPGRGARAPSRSSRRCGGRHPPGSRTPSPRRPTSCATGCGSPAATATDGYPPCRCPAAP